MIRLLPGLILAAALSPALAADSPAPEGPTLFRVELIVFENLDPAALQAEQWLDDPGTPPVDHAMDLNHLTAAATAVAAASAPPGSATPAASPATPVAATPAAATTPVVTPAASPAAPALPAWRWLTPAELRLNGAERKLIASGRYHPLLHVGWIQPLDTSEHGTPVHIYDGMHPDAATPPEPPAPAAPPAPPGAASPPVDAAPPPSAAAPAPLPVLNGVLTLWRGRFLHADVDLGYRRTYTPPAPPTAALPPPAEGAPAESAPPPPQPVTLDVRMTQSRRLRDDELHYLDHPLFGALLMVSPVKETPAAGSKGQSE